MRRKLWVGVLMALVASVARVPIGSTAAAAPPPGTPLDEVAGCDPLDPSACLLPFPNDHFTVADPTTDTGRRVNLSALAMPQNVAGKPIDPTEWNRNDGFSPGAMILTLVPGLDLATSNAPTIDRPELSLKKESPIQVIDADS
ncbi:MAG: hypothetical protein JJE05_12840, partial [Actinobacteria bacterium]|nr:hypothetical protein [Actinomycetota bacterium]